MPTIDVLDTVNSVLAQLMREEWGKALSTLRNEASKLPPQHFGALVRTGLRVPNITMTQCLALEGIWTSGGKPDLKPNTIARRVRLISDATADNVASLTRLFGATYGMDIEVSFSAFDSVEQEGLDPESESYAGKWDIIVLMLSEHWLKRYFGTGALVADADFKRAFDTAAQILRALIVPTESKIVVTTIPCKTYPPPSGWVRVGNLMGWNLAIARFNQELTELANSSFAVIDLGAAIATAGGAAALGRASQIRARMAFETKGAIAVARALADCIAGISGKLHRAAVVDWDNTLWGGEVAEAGPIGVTIGPDSAEGLGYFYVQEYLKGLRDVGVVLAGISRNQPSVVEVLTRHPGLVLRRGDFASLQIGFGRKSEYLLSVSQELGFGTEFMVYMDDSPFELAEVLCEHPHADIVLAGPDPLDTLDRLSAARIGNYPILTNDDLARAARMDGLRQQREMAGVSANGLDEFLKSIDIHLSVKGLSDDNIGRVEQMFQKTNQFNLTTRRHQQADLCSIVECGGKILAFEYTDRFGSQGVIGVLTLLPQEGRRFYIESFLMSCRVLNRRVEHAMIECAVRFSGGTPLLGEYRSTEKNALVRNLYRDFGFDPFVEDNSNKDLWILDTKAPTFTRMQHFAKLIIEED